MPIGEGKKVCQYKRTCIMLSLYDKFNSNILYYSGDHELRIILIQGIVIFRI